LPGVELRIADDGEILARGGNVFSGYLERPVDTEEALVDGWLHTGDLGELTADGYLRIIGRKKEIMITSSGKNLSPHNIEEVVANASPVIGQVLAYADDRPYVSALVVLDPDGARTWAAERGLDTDLATLAHDADLEVEVARAVAAANGTLARVEQVKRWTVLADEWTPASGELTPTMKVRRSVVHERYRDTIAAMY
jgi:long-chain acyl-CoA synthetase